MGNDAVVLPLFYFVCPDLRDLRNLRTLTCVKRFRRFVPDACALFFSEEQLSLPGRDK